MVTRRIIFLLILILTVTYPVVGGQSSSGWWIRLGEDSGSIEDPEEKVHYDIRFEQGKRYKFLLEVPQYVDLDIKVYDQEGNLVAAGINSEGLDERVLFIPAQPGLFDIYVYYYSEEDTEEDIYCEYYLEIWRYIQADPYEQNDSMDGAYRLGELASGHRFQSKPAHFVDGDSDWYRFQITSYGRLTVETDLLGDDSNTAIWLYDKQGTQLAHNINVDRNDLSSRLTQQVTPGTYYLKVNHNGDYYKSENEYKFLILPPVSGYRLSKLKVEDVKLDALSTVSVQLTNHDSVADILVELYVDNQQVDSTRVHLAGGASRKISFTYCFHQGGKHSVKVATADESLSTTVIPGKPDWPDCGILPAPITGNKARVKLDVPADSVRVWIYDLTGHQVRYIDGRNFDISALASGLYLYRIRITTDGYSWSSPVKKFLIDR